MNIKSGLKIILFFFVLKGTASGLAEVRKEYRNFYKLL
jgi:hypothetical protein